MEEWTLNDEQVKEIFNSKPVKISESNVFNDLTLSIEERIKHAKTILESRKNF